MILIVFTDQNLLDVTVALVTGTLAISALWIAATNRRFRWWAGGAAVVLVGVTLGSLIATGRGLVEVVAAIAGIATAFLLGTASLRWEVRNAVADRWHRARRRDVASSS